MAQILDLPNELLLGIIGVIRVEDIEAFASCNKRIFSLSQNVLQKHRAMKKKYSKVQLTASNLDTLDLRQWVHSVAWLREILLDETVASYPIHLHIQQRAIGGTVFDGYDGFRQTNVYRIMAEIKEEIYSKLEECPYIQSHNLERWKLDLAYPLHYEWFDISLALLLTLLPNLQSILIDARNLELGRTRYVYTRVAEAYEADGEVQHALSQLVSLDQTIVRGCSGHLTSMHYYLPFRVLPLLRSVSGRNFDGRVRKYNADSSMADGSEVAEGMPRTFNSGITNIKFTKSRISSLGFENLLCGVTGLQDFEYEHAGDRPGLFQPWWPRKIVNSLLAHARHSLRRLDLTSQDKKAVGVHRTHEWGDMIDIDTAVDVDVDDPALRGCVFIRSLRYFQVLKTVRLNSAMFVEKVPSTETNSKESSKVHRLVDILPTSIEELHLVEGLVHHPLVRIFHGLAESKAQNLPILKEIKLERINTVTFLSLKKACRDAGIELIVVKKPQLRSSAVLATSWWKKWTGN